MFTDYPVFLLAMIFNSCKTTTATVDYKDLSYLYNPTKSPINPRYNVLNQTDDSSDISVSFLLAICFSLKPILREFRQHMVLVTVKLYNMTQGKALTDTAVLNLNIVKETGKQEYIYQVPLKVEKGTEYLAEVKILDRLRLIVVTGFCSV